MSPNDGDVWDVARTTADDLVVVCRGGYVAVVDSDNVIVKHVSCSAARRALAHEGSLIICSIPNPLQSFVTIWR
jgi:hypothetical protein